VEAPAFQRESRKQAPAAWSLPASSPGGNQVNPRLTLVHAGWARVRRGKGEGERRIPVRHATRTAESSDKKAGGSSHVQAHTDTCAARACEQVGRLLNITSFGEITERERKRERETGGALRKEPVRETWAILPSRPFGRVLGPRQRQVVDSALRAVGPRIDRIVLTR